MAAGPRMLVKLLAAIRFHPTWPRTYPRPSGSGLLEAEADERLPVPRAVAAHDRSVVSVQPDDVPARIHRRRIQGPGTVLAQVRKNRVDLRGRGRNRAIRGRRRLHRQRESAHVLIADGVGAVDDVAHVERSADDGRLDRSAATLEAGDGYRHDRPQFVEPHIDVGPRASIAAGN